MQLEIDAIQESDNPRKAFDATKLEELAATIDARGLLQPIVVREVHDGAFQLVAGERRLRACKSLGHKTIEVVVKDVADAHMALVQIIENSAREGLTPLEEALAVGPALEAAFGDVPTKDAKNQLAKQLGWGLRKIEYTLALGRASDYVQFYGKAFSVYSKEKDDLGSPILGDDEKPLMKRHEFSAMDVSYLRELVRLNKELRNHDAKILKSDGSHRPKAEKVIKRLGDKASLDGWSLKQLKAETKRILLGLEEGKKPPKAIPQKKSPVFTATKMPPASLEQMSALTEDEKKDVAANLEDFLRAAGFSHVEITP